MVGNNENIYVEFDYNNITIIDPNKVIDDEGNVKERFVKQEDLVMYANLECKVLPRTKLALGVSNDDRLQTISVASINFLKQGDKDKLDNSYTDEITGKGTLEGKGVNQIKQDWIKNPRKNDDYYLRQTLQSNGEPGAVDNGLLGITSINIRQGLDFLPTIKMTLEDIKGRAMFESGDSSPYAAFFNLPYPKFYLTIKGYYGKAVRLQLMLQNFSSRYDTNDGNFKVELIFYTYKYTILSEIQMGSIMATPHMYKSRVKILTNQNSSSQFSNVEDGIVEIGYQKIKEVYTEYKSKKLIDSNFPEITLVQLRNRIDNFVKNVLDTFTKENLDPLTDLDTYYNQLEEYQKDIYFAVGVKSGSWFERYMDKNNYFILNDNEKTKVYSYKKEFNNPQSRQNTEAELNELINKYNEKLNENPTVGKDGGYVINNKETKKEIENPIKFSTFRKEINVSQLDLNETYRQLKGINTPTPKQIEEFKSELVKDKVFNSLEIFNITGSSDKVFYYYVFEGSKNFLGLTDKMFKDLRIIREEIETKLTDALSELLKSGGDNGIGFVPTIRNVLAIIFANGEGFLRLMDDVHRNAWEQRDTKYRKDAIFNSDVANANQDNLNSGENETTPVYPWPQFIVATNGVEGQEQYVIEYPGNPKYTNITKGYLYNVWPEVEFVEEYIRGLTERTNPPNETISTLNELTQTKRLSFNAIEFPIGNEVFFNKEKVKYFYEIFERLYVLSNYNGFVRTNGLLESDNLSNIIADSENTNILDSLSNDNPFIIKDLKELNINSNNFQDILRHMSNEGVGESWQNFIRGIFNTSYLNNLTENGEFTFLSNELLNNEITEPLSSIQNESKINEYVKSTKSNALTFTDIYPFINLNWNKLNLEYGNKISDNSSVMTTSKTLTYNNSKKIISNFNNETTTNQIRPISNFNFKVIETPTGYLTNLETFYNFRLPFYQLPTEGNLNYSNYEGLVSSTQTVSMLNTPYFINAIQEGIDKSKNKENNPYVSATYLFINSLPLATLREKFKTYNDDNSQSDLNYIFATLKKFSGIHKVPYAWVLKIGSEWFRYKKYIENNVDILSNVWEDFNQIDNFDPITQSPIKQYKLNINGVNYDFGLEKTNTSLSNNLQVETQSSIINTGFYPKTINDFSYFINGSEVFNGYSDNEIQDGINNNLSLTYVQESVINHVNPPIIDGSISIIKDVRVVPWSVVLNNDEFSYILPSNGSLINQTNNECIDNGFLKFNIVGNQSMFNGSTRLFWSAPNYGYFDNSKVVKPTPEQHLKKIFVSSNEQNRPFLGGSSPQLTLQENFSINGLNETYSDISEMFSVFDKETLDKFEKEFLLFSNDAVNYIDDSKDEVGNQIFKNFQLLMRELLKVPTTINNTGYETVREIQDYQTTNLSNLINDFLSYDITFKFGNPSNFNKKLFTTFSSNPVVDSFSWGQYTIETPNALPTQTNNITLLQSQTQYPGEWITLKSYIGFSTIPELTYGDFGSYITDFFIDNNVAFTTNNIVNLHPIIKIYATQKLLNNSMNNSQFIINMNNYLNSTEEFQNKLTNNLMTKLRLNLPDVDSISETIKNSEINGNQTKLELWETFKALNDKWIAGNDFKVKTLFEDVLLLDRASRDVGDKIFIDIYKLKSMLTDINVTTTMLTFIQTLLVENNFVIMNIPSYVNFYNVQDAVNNPTPREDGSLEVANTLFGTFNNVDYRDSSAKMVCFYSNKPSSILDLKNNPDYRFKSDTFDLRRISDNPLSEDRTNKTDWAMSNKVVGFNVDVGPQNQSIFYSFRVAQDPGKATAESLSVITQMANQYGNRGSSTQNVSLYNLYKNRSYTCTISMMGNALIQPTMYFNLRHVPMFTGPYMIQRVDHTITPGNFETIIEGIRQPTASLPKVDDYLQTLRTNLLKNIIDKDRSDRTKNTTTTTTISNNVITQKNNIFNELTTQPQKTIDNSQTNQCSENLYSGYYGNSPTSITPLSYSLSYQDIKDIIVNNTSNNEPLRNIIFSAIYLYSNNGNKITSFEYNLTGTKLDNEWNGDLIKFFRGNSTNLLMSKKSLDYYCSSNNIPYAIFQNEVQHVRFLNDRWVERAKEVLLNKQSITKFLINNINSTITDDSIYTNMTSSDIEIIENKVQEAINKYESTN